MSDLGNETVTLIDQAAADAFGDATGPPTETPVDGCMVEPTSTSETTGGRDTVVTEARVWAPPGTTVTARQQARWRGDLYEVFGQLPAWVDFDGAEDHVAFRLRRVQG